MKLLATGDETAGQELDLQCAKLATELRVRTVDMPSPFRVIAVVDYDTPGNYPGQTPPAGATLYILRMWGGGVCPG
jgi:hypothetical protein